MWVKSYLQSYLQCIFTISESRVVFRILPLRTTPRMSYSALNSAGGTWQQNQQHCLSIVLCSRGSKNR